MTNSCRFYLLNIVSCCPSPRPSPVLIPLFRQSLSLLDDCNSLQTALSPSRLKPPKFILLPTRISFGNLTMSLPCWKPFWVSPFSKADNSKSLSGHLKGSILCRPTFPVSLFCSVLLVGYQLIKSSIQHILVFKRGTHHFLKITRYPSKNTCLFCAWKNSGLVSE